MSTVSLALPEKSLQRRVPHGKVYKQIFDDEVKLVHSLNKSRQELPVLLHQPRCSNPPVAGQTTLEPSRGMLTSRQLMWMNEMPNESATENPVLYKFYVDQSKEAVKVCDEEQRPKAEVQGLPDVLVPAKVGSNIIDRIENSRKLRYDAAIDDMNHELGVISTELEPAIETLCQQLMNELENDNEELDKLAATISTDEVLLDCSMEQLECHWSEIMEHFASRKAWIHQLDDNLNSVENDRVSQMRCVYERSWKLLEKIAYLPAADQQRMLDKDCQLINQVVLNNKRMYANLTSKLLIADIDRERKMQVYWRKRVDVWKRKHIERAVELFVSYMSSDEIVRPPAVERLMQEMKEQQIHLNQQRVDLVNSLNNLSPPTLKVQVVEKWLEQIVGISKRLEETNQSFFNKLSLEYEAVCQTCLGEIMNLKDSLIERRLCTEVEAGDVVNSKCLPVIGERQSCFEKLLEALDKAMEEASQTSLKQLKQLYKFGQAIGQIWEAHEINLARLENTLHERLDELRQQHDTVNQEREAALDVTVDRMRQEATEAALKEGLAKALQMLATIRLSYDEFYEQQLPVVAGYPNIVQAEVAAYSTNVCSFFSVRRAETEGDEKVAVAASQPSTSSTSLQSLVGQLGSEAVVTENGVEYVTCVDSKPSAASKRSKTSTNPVLPVDKVDEDQTASGKDSQAFVTELPEGSATVGDVNVGNVTYAIAIDTELIMSVCKSIRQNVLNHLESWKVESGRRSTQAVDAKVTELTSELDLRVHLHEPRARRTELDVHNVRAAELAMHSERVSRHVNGVEQTLVELRQLLVTMSDNVIRQCENFQNDVNKLETSFTCATKTARLNELSAQLKRMQVAAMVEVRATIEQFNSHLLTTVRSLRDSTARFTGSFKLFSEGGNFCPAEVTDYTKRLEKVIQKIDVTEQSILAEVKTIEPKLADQTIRIVQEMENRFKNDQMDVAFVEKVARWLTNTQVRIKAEVAESNCQCQNINQALHDLEKLIVGCETPGPDTGYVKPDQVLDALSPIIESVHQRCVYLRCLNEQPASQPTAQSNNGTVGVANANVVLDEPVPPISKPGGKAPVDDASVNTIRQILKTQKASSDDVSGEGGHKTDSVDSLAAVNSSAHTNAKQQSKGGRSTGMDGKLKAVGSGNEQKRTKPGKSVAGGKNKMDVKYFVFGENAEPDEGTYFSGRIRTIVRDTLAAVLAMAEPYYKQKGPRPTTRPDLMQESLEHCAETVIEKLQLYVTQTESYRDRCIEDFFRQLCKLESLNARVPRCVTQQILQTALSESDSEQEQQKAAFSELYGQLESLRSRHENMLRPALGHPDKQTELCTLCQEESDRNLRAMNIIYDVDCSRKSALSERGRVFFETLSNSAEQLLLLFDSMLVGCDIRVPKKEPPKHAPSELVRRRKAGVALSDEQTADCSSKPQGPTTWPGLPCNELNLPESTYICRPAESSDSQVSADSRRVVDSKQSKLNGNNKKQSASNSEHLSVTTNQSDVSEVRRQTEDGTANQLKATSSSTKGSVSSQSVKTSKSSTTSGAGSKSQQSLVGKGDSSTGYVAASVKTSKATSAHTASIVARDEAFKVFKCYFESTARAIETDVCQLSQAEARWKQYWLTAVDRVRQLY